MELTELTESTGAQVYPNGEVSQALDRLRPGDKIALKGPFGKFVYKPGKYKAIGAVRPLGWRVQPSLPARSKAPLACCPGVAPLLYPILCPSGTLA